MSAINNIILSTPSDKLEKVLSPFIREQFPSFVREDYGKLVLFIKAYYEWLDSEGNPGYVTANLDDVGDVDGNLDQFYSHFKSMYLDGFPELFTENESGQVPNKKTLLKKIREFYGKKGTESAYRFLFRVLYDSDLEIYYPSSDLLKSSDGQWIEPVSIKTTTTNGQGLFGGKGGHIYQYSGSEVSASAFINSVVQYSFTGLPVTEFFVTDINGIFNPDQEVTVINGDSKWTERTYSVLGEFYVELPGSGYRIGDTVTLFDANGKGFSAKVQQTGLAGGVKKIDIINSGLNYQTNPAGASADYFLLTIFSDTGQQSAKVYGKRSALTRYPGYFSGNRGKLSSNKKIQDSNYYQTFSYELKGAVSLDNYFDVLKNLVHPSGTKMFGSILVKAFINNSITSSTQATYYETPVIGKYTPYKTTTNVDLRNNGITVSGYWLGATGDLYPLGYNPYIGSTAQVGPNGRTTPVGTVFVGGSLGYTWCYVPEDGITAHDPIGAPLGSTTAWYSGNETSWTPAEMRGLVLWLRPENIGVCGAVVNGATVDVWRDSSPQQNHALPPTWGRINGSASVGAGITIDKLRPRLFAASIAGPTGVCFNGGVLYSPSSTWNGISLAQGVCLGTTYGSGSIAGQILTAQHLYLTNGITLSDDADVFMVFRSTSDDWKRGVGLVGSNTSISGISGNDAVIYNRSYNEVDRDPAKQTSEYYSVTPTGKFTYPTALPVGLVGFRPGAGLQSSQQNSVAYDPHVSGACMGTVIGEWSRRGDGVVESFLNGDKSLNKSRSTGRFITSVKYLNTEDYLIRNGLILFFDGKSVLSRGEVSDAYNSNLFYRYASPWVYGNVSTNLTNGRMSNWNSLATAVGENNIVYDYDPWGDPNLIWNAQPTDATTSYSADGGWNGPIIDIDPTKTYRFSFWLNRKVWGTGSYYVGAYGYNSETVNVGLISRNSGVQHINQYFTSFAPTTTALPQNVWQLVCHHIHPAGSGIGADHPDSGYYFLSTGIAGKRTYGNDLVWTPESSRGRFRTYLYYATTNNAIQQWVYPRVDVVDGSEPSVQDLLDNKPNTWVDVSSTGLTGTFVGNSPHLSVNDGVIEFNGGNYFKWKSPTVSVYDANSTSPNKRVNKFTYEMWMKPTHSSSDSDSFLLGVSPNGADQFITYSPSSERLNILLCAWQDHLQEWMYLPVNSVPRNKWTQFVIQIDNNTVNVYLNGKFVQQYIPAFNSPNPALYPNGLPIAPWDNTSYQGDPNNPAVWTIGVRSDPRWFYSPEAFAAGYSSYANLGFKGQVSNIRLYNRILNSQEILQNYSILRNRVGL